MNSPRDESWAADRSRRRFATLDNGTDPSAHTDVGHVDSQQSSRDGTSDQRAVLLIARLSDDGLGGGWVGLTLNS